MPRTINTIIDPELCTGCGKCQRVCPSQTLGLTHGKAVVVGTTSMGCGHCVAACPEGAIQVAGLASPLSFKTFRADNRWLAPGDFDTAALVRLMASRRSCRKYRETTVDRGILEDLVIAGTTAPSGTNSQKWTFTILPDRQQVIALGNQIAGTFKKLNAMAARKSLRLLARLLGNRALDDYYRKYYRTMQEGIREWEQEGRDRLFHGAPAALLIGSEPSASCPKEDALLACQNILLTAHAMGLGSCLIGFAVAALNREPAIKKNLGIPREEEIHAVIALGYPDETYHHTITRKAITPRYPVHS